MAGIVDATEKNKDDIPPSKLATVHSGREDDNQSTTSTKHSMLTVYDPKAVHLHSEKCPATNAIDGADGQEQQHPYRWYILVGGFLAQAVSNSILSSWGEDKDIALSIFRGIMQNYYDHNVFHGTVDATKLNFVATIALTFCGLLGPVNQILTDLFRGPRTIMGVSTVLMSLGLFSASYSTEIWHLYLTQSILYGIGSALFFIISMAICPMWFPRNRGLAMGVIVSGSGVGGLVTPFIMHALNESLGGAWCYRILALLTLVLGSLVTLLLRERNERSNKDANAISLDLNVFRSLDFCIWCVAGNLCTMAYFIPAFYLPSYASRLGLTTARGSQLVAVFSATNIIGRLLSGYLGDKLGALNVNISFLAMGGASSLFMWHYATNFAELVAFVVVYGIMSATVFTLIAPITATVTGNEKYSSGISLYLFALTFARLGPSIAGAIQAATSKDSFDALQMFAGWAFFSSALVATCLRFKMKPSLLAKI
ncbi:hypothetical protein VTP01DRAFT_1376 [Rhizomucor pusillus]|uniref:uncharacterized protein n=1 Tax=Rhizomucor pusillus TaxID=4840 RepID=UPI00374402CC